jgi:L-arabinose transport system ATP-binding protein
MENLNLVVRRQLSRLGFVIDKRRERENARRYVEQLSVKTSSLAEPVRNLSGGNQQKVVLGRWLAGRVKVMLLDEPTRGIDVGAKSEIYSLIYDLAREGVGVVVCSSELQELLGICDRIVVMRQGRIVASLAREEATPEAVLALALPASERRAEAAVAS